MDKKKLLLPCIQAYKTAFNLSMWIRRCQLDYTGHQPDRLIDTHFDSNHYWATERFNSNWGRGSFSIWVMRLTLIQFAFSDCQGIVSRSDSFLGVFHEVLLCLKNYSTNSYRCINSAGKQIGFHFRIKVRVLVSLSAWNVLTQLNTLCPGGEQSYIYQVL